MINLRNTTKEYKEVINLKGWKMFDLYYGFVPQNVENCGYPEQIKKVQKDNEKYIVRINGNLWYEKQMA